MAILDQMITDRYALYCGDCMEVMPNLPDGAIHFSVYSPPFAGLAIQRPYIKIPSALAAPTAPIIYHTSPIVAPCC